MKISDFDFSLPERLIAQTPAPQRDQSRMLVVWRDTGRREHHVFSDLPDILNSRQFLVANNTKVFPARLRAARVGKKENVEVLLLRERAPGEWIALVKPGRKARPGEKFVIGGVTATVIDATESGSRIFSFEPGVDLPLLFEKVGEPPLPPYIRRDGRIRPEDRVRYQTVYAKRSGSVAAPTAGLHFTEEVFRRLGEKGIPVCEVLLHVGYGTFQPVRCDNIVEHRMEPEYYEIDADVAGRIKEFKAEGRSLVAVGTTTTRCLEFLASREDGFSGASSGFCNPFIYPGFRFRAIDGLVTNFHLPRSTLFMLVCAFAGRDLALDCYHEAISQEYRFYSYGDCMLIL